MKKNRPPEKKVWFLSCLWLASYLLAGVLAIVYMFSTVMKTGAMPVLRGSTYARLVFASVLFWFLPLLFCIRHHAKRAQIHWLSTVSVCIIVFLSLWTLGMIASAVLIPA